MRMCVHVHVHVCVYVCARACVCRDVCVDFNWAFYWLIIAGVGSSVTLHVVFLIKHPIRREVPALELTSIKSPA